MERAPPLKRRARRHGVCGSQPRRSERSRSWMRLRGGRERDAGGVSDPGARVEAEPEPPPPRGRPAPRERAGRRVCGRASDAGGVSDHSASGCAAPAWAWVAITLMALLLASGLTTLAVARNADPSTPEAVEDVQTLVVELEALERLPGDDEPADVGRDHERRVDERDRAGQARGPVGTARRRRSRRRTGALAPWRASSPGRRAPSSTRVSSSFSLSSGLSRSGAGGSRSNSSRRSAGMSRPRRQGRGATAGLQSRERERGSDRGARGQAGRDRAVQGSAPGRGRPAQGGGRAGQGGRSGPAGGHSGPAGACARRRCSDPTAEAVRGGAPSDRRPAELEALVS